MPSCLSCGRDTYLTNLCPMCAATVPAGAALWRQVKADLPGTAGVGTETDLQWYVEKADKIESQSNGVLKANLADWVGHMCTFLTERGYWTSKTATGAGDQHTPRNCESGTVSLDFQGLREGSGGSYWIDLQGQAGGGGSKRKSYCQVLIQNNLGGPVPAGTITAALAQSLKDGKKRAIIHRAGSAARPKGSD